MSRRWVAARAAMGMLVLGLLACFPMGVFLAPAGSPAAAGTASPAPVAARVTIVNSSPPPVVTASSPATVTLATGLALTPPMGWNGFNRFHTAVTAARVEAAARALDTSAMKEAGYTYVNLDGGWDLPMRTVGGALQIDRSKFPQGIKPVADYVHSLGLKFGIYTSAGMQNCARTSAGSYGHYRQDATTFASWGVDYLKLDWCWIPYRNYPGMTVRAVGQMLARQMGDALAATGRQIVYDVNEPDGNLQGWARGTAHMWRTAPDIQDNYLSMVSNFTRNVSQFGQAGPGGWNDPDMLEVGNGGMTLAEYQSQFTLWAEMAAPLIAGNDLTMMSADARRILTNTDVIAVDQDPLGRQGHVVASAQGHWVLSKPLATRDIAIVLFNQTNTSATISTTTAQVGLAGAPEYALLNVWTDALTVTAGTITDTVPAHSVVMYVVHRGRADLDDGWQPLQAL